LKTICAPRKISTLPESHEKLLGIGDAGDSIGIMETRPAANRTEAFTRAELFVVIAVIAVLAATLFAALITVRRIGRNMACVYNLSCVNTAFKVWEGDAGDKYPMYFALTNNETMDLIGHGKAYVLWQTMSNEFGTPKYLNCPADTERIAATNFAKGFSDANISYFFSLDTTVDIYLQMILDGDDNLAVNGVRVKPGILTLPINGSLTWTKERHRGVGIIGMADGSIQQTTPSSLWTAMIAATNGAPVATCRWVIP
jgi:hypothetical protein